MKWHICCFLDECVSVLFCSHMVGTGLPRPQAVIVMTEVCSFSTCPYHFILISVLLCVFLQMKMVSYWQYLLQCNVGSSKEWHF